MRSRQYSKIGKHEGIQKKETRRFEFSKIMALIAISMWLFVNFFGMAMVIFTMDTSPLMYVIPSVDAVVAAIIGFYLWKARAENQIKLRKIYGVDVGVTDDMMYGGGYSNSYYTPVVSDAPLYENSNIV